MARIIELYAENFKRIKAVQIKPDGPVQVVSGRNAQGKSSAIGAIEAVLDWKTASRSTSRPVRDGEDFAKGVLNLGDLIVTRTWDAKNDKTTLLVTTPDGTPQAPPQQILDTLMGKMVDPLAFSNQTDSEQVRTLASLVPLPFDLDQMDKDRKDLYEKRHAVGQEETRAKGAFESMPTPDADLPDAEVPMAALTAEYQAAQDEITRHNDVRRDLGTAETARANAAQGVKDAEEALTKALAKNAEAMVAHDAARKAVDDLGQPPSVGPIKERMDAAESTNAAVRDAAGWRAKKAEWQEKTAEWKRLDADMAALDKQRADGLAAAVFPVPGLSFGETGVTYNGVPFAQASQAERLRVSLVLAMAANPVLRVIRIMDGSLLDDDSMAMIEAMAEEHDFQIWIERVGGDAGVVIEDGKVV